MKKLTCTNGLTVSIRMSSNKYDIVVSFGHIILHPDIYMGGARLNIATDGNCICNLTLAALYKVLIWVNSRSRKEIYKMLFSQMHCEIDPLFDLAELEAFAN